MNLRESSGLRRIVMPALLAVGCLGMAAGEFRDRGDDASVASVKGGVRWACNLNTSWTGGACAPACLNPNYVTTATPGSCYASGGWSCGTCGGTYSAVDCCVL